MDAPCAVSALDAARFPDRTWLQRVPMFASLNADALDTLLAQSRSADHARGNLVFRQGEPATRFYIIRSGRLKVYRATADGREHILHVFGPGEVCGEVPVFQGGDYPASAAATCRTRTLSITRDAFLDCARRNPDMLLTMLGALSERLRRFAAMIEDLSLRDVPGRLARFLLAESDRVQRPVFEVEGAKREWAERLGTTPETLSRALARMQRRDWINVRGRTIRLKQPEALAKLAIQSEPPVVRG